MATKVNLKKHALVKDQKDEDTQEIPPGFNSTAHRFAKGTRDQIEQSQRYMKVPADQGNPDQRLFTPTPDLRKLFPGEPSAPLKETRDMDGPIDQGLARMQTQADAKDQFYDNVNWYTKFYGKMPKFETGVTEHGEDLGKVFLGDEYFSFLARKKEKAWALQYDLYKLQMVDLSTPSLRSYWQKAFPELYERKMLYYRNAAQLKAKFDELTARGFQDENDMKFLYLYNMGVFEKSTPEDVADYMQNPTLSRIWTAALEGRSQEWNDEMHPTDVPVGNQINWQKLKWPGQEARTNPGGAWFPMIPRQRA